MDHFIYILYLPVSITHLENVYLFPCSPLSPSEGLDTEVLFDLELTGLLTMKNSSPSPAAASECISLCLLNLL